MNDCFNLQFCIQQNQKTEGMQRTYACMYLVYTVGQLVTHKHFSHQRTPTKISLGIRWCMSGFGHFRWSTHGWGWLAVGWCEFWIL